MLAYPLSFPKASQHAGGINPFVRAWHSAAVVARHGLGLGGQLRKVAAVATQPQNLGMRSSIKPFKLVHGTAGISTQAFQQHSLCSGPSSEGGRTLHSWVLGSIHRAGDGELGDGMGSTPSAPRRP